MSISDPPPPPPPFQADLFDPSNRNSHRYFLNRVGCLDQRDQVTEGITWHHCKKKNCRKRHTSGCDHKHPLPKLFILLIISHHVVVYLWLCLPLVSQLVSCETAVLAVCGGNKTCLHFLHKLKIIIWLEWLMKREGIINVIPIKASLISAHCVFHTLHEALAVFFLTHLKSFVFYPGLIVWEQFVDICFVYLLLLFAVDFSWSFFFYNPYLFLKECFDILKCFSVLSATSQNVKWK